MGRAQSAAQRSEQRTSKLLVGVAHPLRLRYYCVSAPLAPSRTRLPYLMLGEPAYLRACT